MTRTDLRRQLTWLVALALLVGALAPGLSVAIARWKAEAGVDSSGWTRLCSTGTDRWIRIVGAEANTGQAPDGGGPSLPATGGDCPFCLSHANDASAPPPALLLTFSSIRGATAPPVASVAIVFAAVWPPSLPRAPPAA